MKARTIILAALSAILFAGCESDRDVTCEFYFTARTGLTHTPWTLQVDGQSIGTITVPETAPNCSNLAGSIGSLLHLSLEGDRHRLEAFDATGTLRSKGTFKCSEMQSKLSGTLGGLSMNGDCDCYIIEVFD